MPENAAQTLEAAVVRAAHWRPGQETASPCEPPCLDGLAQNDVLWVHVVARDARNARELLTERFGLDPYQVGDALSSAEWPSVHQSDRALFCVVTTVEILGDAERYVEVGVFLGHRFVVTVVTEPAPVIDEWFDRWCAAPHMVGPTPSNLLEALLDAIVDDYFPASDRLEEEVDRLEESVFDGGDRQVIGRALDIKRRLLEMRRRIASVRDVTNVLLRSDVRFVSPEVRPALQDVYDHTLRVADNTDLNREVLSAVMDAHLSVVSNSLNEVMRVLTVVATILMSLALVAGVYGMNFEFMPELRWPWGYGFALGLMAVIAAAEWLYFRRRGWV